MVTWWPTGVRSRLNAVSSSAARVTVTRGLWDAIWRTTTTYPRTHSTTCPSTTTQTPTVGSPIYSLMQLASWVHHIIVSAVWLMRWLIVGTGYHQGFPSDPSSPSPHASPSYPNIPGQQFFRFDSGHPSSDGGQPFIFRWVVTPTSTAVPEFSALSHNSLHVPEFSALSHNSLPSSRVVLYWQWGNAARRVHHLSQEVQESAGVEWPHEAPRRLRQRQEAGKCAAFTSCCLLEYSF